MLDENVLDYLKSQVSEANLETYLTLGEVLNSLNADDYYEAHQNIISSAENYSPDENVYLLIDAMRKAMFEVFGHFNLKVDVDIPIRVGVAILKVFSDIKLYPVEDIQSIIETDDSLGEQFSQLVLLITPELNEYDVLDHLDEVPPKIFDSLVELLETQEDSIPLEDELDVIEANNLKVMRLKNFIRYHDIKHLNIYHLIRNGLKPGLSFEAYFKLIEDHLIDMPLDDLAVTLIILTDFSRDLDLDSLSDENFISEAVPNPDLNKIHLLTDTINKYMLSYNRTSTL